MSPWINSLIYSRTMYNELLAEQIVRYLNSAFPDKAQLDALPELSAVEEEKMVEGAGCTGTRRSRRVQGAPLGFSWSIGGRGKYRHLQ
jgi:hypothetical protein